MGVGDSDQTGDGEWSRTGIRIESKIWMGIGIGMRIVIRIGIRVGMGIGMEIGLSLQSGWGIEL